MTNTTETTLEILKQDRLGRVRVSEERRKALLEEYERSGMSGQEYAAFVGIKYQTFATWVQKRRRNGNAGAGEAAAGGGRMQWVEAVVEKSAGGGVLVVHLGGGAKMEVGDERGAVLAAEVMRQLGIGRC